MPKILNILTSKLLIRTFRESSGRKINGFDGRRSATRTEDLLLNIGACRKYYEQNNIILWFQQISSFGNKLASQVAKWVKHCSNITPMHPQKLPTEKNKKEALKTKNRKFNYQWQADQNTIAEFKTFNSLLPENVVHWLYNA